MDLKQRLQAKIEKQNATNQVETTPFSWESLLHSCVEFSDMCAGRPAKYEAAALRRQLCKVELALRTAEEKLELADCEINSGTAARVIRAATATITGINRQPEIGTLVETTISLITLLYDKLEFDDFISYTRSIRVIAKDPAVMNTHAGRFSFARLATDFIALHLCKVSLSSVNGGSGSTYQLEAILRTLVGKDGDGIKEIDQQVVIPMLEARVLRFEGTDWPLGNQIIEELEDTLVKRPYIKELLG